MISDESKISQRKIQSLTYIPNHKTSPKLHYGRLNLTNLIKILRLTAKQMKMF